MGIFAVTDVSVYLITAHHSDILVLGVGQQFSFEVIKVVVLCGTCSYIGSNFVLSNYNVIVDEGEDPAYSFE